VPTWVWFRFLRVLYWRASGVVGVELLPVQPQRILRLEDLVTELRHDAVLRQPPLGLDVAQMAVCGTVVTRAIGVHAGGAGRHGQCVADGCTACQSDLIERVAADVDGTFEVSLRDGLADQRDHPAGRVAVQGREWPANDLDALGIRQVEVTHLTLAVGHGGRDAVGVQTQAAHAEGGPSAEAPRTDLQILRVVVAVVDHQTRNAGHCFGQVHHGAGGPQRAVIDHAGCEGRVLQITDCP